MKIVIHDSLMRPQTIEVSRVVVYDQFDNPIQYALEFAPGRILADTLREGHEAQFSNMLKDMGINKVVHVQPIEVQNLDQVKFD